MSKKNWLWFESWWVAETLLSGNVLKVGKALDLFVRLLAAACSLLGWQYSTNSLMSSHFTRMLGLFENNPAPFYESSPQIFAVL